MVENILEDYFFKCKAAAQKKIKALEAKPENCHRFWEKYKNKLCCPIRMKKFYSHYQNNVDLAVVAYNKWACWWLECGIYQLNAKICSKLLSQQTVTIAGFDKKKRLTLVCRPVFHNGSAYTIDELLEYIYFILEHAIETAKLRNLSSQLVLIYDRRGTTEQNIDKNRQDLIKHTEQLINNYIGYLDQVYIVSQTTSWSEWGSNYISQSAAFLSNSLMGKFVYVGPDSAQLLNAYEPTQLYSIFGGQLDCSNYDQKSMWS